VPITNIRNTQTTASAIHKVCWSGVPRNRAISEQRLDDRNCVHSGGTRGRAPSAFASSAHGARSSSLSRLLAPEQLPLKLVGGRIIGFEPPATNPAIVRSRRNIAMCKASSRSRIPMTKPIEASTARPIRSHPCAQRLPPDCNVLRPWGHRRTFALFEGVDLGLRRVPSAWDRRVQLMVGNPLSVWRQSVGRGRALLSTRGNCKCRNRLSY